MSAATLPRRIAAVVIGASAGGVDALGVLLPALPARLAVPVFVVLHLPRDRKSRLADVFQPRCERPVCEAEDKLPITPGTVYLAPPDYHLLIDEGPALALSADPAVNFSRPSIDVLFEGAAVIYGTRLAAVLLTGANDDGAAGIAAVARAGGVTIVQDPGEALAPTMVESAMRRTGVDFVWRLATIAEALRSLGEESVHE